MSKFSSLVVKNVTATDDANASSALGQLFYDMVNAKAYQYVKLDTGTSAIAAANGAVAYWKGPPANFTVTTKLSYAAGTTAANNQNLVAGIFLNAATTGNYTLIQKGGRHTAVVCSIGGVIGDQLVASATTNGEASNVAAGTAPGFRIIGIALADKAANAVDTMLVLDGFVF